MRWGRGLLVQGFLVKWRPRSVVNGMPELFGLILAKPPESS